jgi:hypothetical protein
MIAKEQKESLHSTTCKICIRTPKFRLETAIFIVSKLQTPDTKRALCLEMAVYLLFMKLKKQRLGGPRLYTIHGRGRGGKFFGGWTIYTLFRFNY